jgi:hypothetical protein
MDTDTRIFHDLIVGFGSSPLGHHGQLSVNVEDGIVTIAGRVNTFAERKAVERAAKRVAGIRTLVLKIGAAALPLSAPGTLTMSQKESPQQQ